MERTTSPPLKSGRPSIFASVLGSQSDFESKSKRSVTDSHLQRYVIFLRSKSAEGAPSRALLRPFA
jgi:hypothetical protein